MRAPDISVIVATRNRAEQAQRCVNHLVAQDLPRAQREIIVVDDGSSDESAARLEAQGWRDDVTVVRLVERQGRARARNAGLAVATGRIIVFVDSDAFAPPWFLRAHLEAHARHSWAIVDGPAINVRRCAPAHFSSVWVRTFAAMDFGGEHFVTVNTSCPREALQRVGGFDADFGIGYGWEDLELGTRLEAAGLARVKARRAFVLHEQADFDLGREVAKQEECGSNGAVFFAKRPTADTLAKIRAHQIGRIAALARIGLTSARIHQLLVGRAAGTSWLRPLLARLYLRQRYVHALQDAMAGLGRTPQP